MAQDRIVHAYRKLAGFQHHFDHQIDELCKPQLHLRRTGPNKYKDGKSVKFASGGVYYKKIGGYRLAHRTDLQTFIDKAKPADFKKYGIVEVRKYDSTKCKELVEKGEKIPGYILDDEDELGSFRIGKTKGWSVKAALKGIEEVAALAQKEEEAE